MSDCNLSEGRIPSSLISTYVQYKKDTGAVIAWLASHGTARYKRLTALSLQDLLSLAEIVKIKAVEMPRTIDFQFREAIAARTSLSNWYRKVHDHYENDDQDTCNHEHFTTCLSKIYNDLCNCCAKPKDKCAQGKKRNKSNERRRSPLNRFASLDPSHDKQNKKGHLEKNQPNTTCPGKIPHFSEDLGVMSKEDKTKGANLPPLRLLDDTLSESFELRKGIQDMHDLLTITQRSWKTVARGETSVLVATFVTYLAFAELEEIGDRLQTSCSIEDPGMLRSKYLKYNQKEQDQDFPIDDDLEPRPSLLATIEALEEYWHAIDQVKRKGPEALSEMQSTRLVPRQGSEYDPNDKECVATVFRIIGYHVMQGSFPNNNIIRLGSPVVDKVCLFLTTEGKDENSLRCSFGLLLILQSYKNMMFTSLAPSMHTAGRLQALKFAQQGTVSIKAALEASKFGCTCPQTVAGHLVRLRSDLEGFMSTKVFDLYFNSPWVSGSHILEMLDALFNAGLRLFNYQSYASSVLHIYNVLRQFNLLAPVPILDKFIESELSEIIFPGGRPNRNFKACYLRSLGGRLCFDSGHQKAKHRSGCHSMRVPSYTGMVTHGIREPKCQGDTDHRFDVEKISMLHFIKSRQYRPTKSNLERLAKSDGAKLKPRMVPRIIHDVANGTYTHSTQPKNDPSSPDQRLQRFGKIIHAELTGPFPMAKINYFTVYITFLRIVSRINDKYHKRPDASSEKGEICVCFTDALMSAADRCRADENCPFGYKGLIEICQEAIEEVLLEKELDEFLWKDL